MLWGNVNLITTQWIPFFALCMLELFEKQSWKSALWASLFFVLTALSSWEYGIWLIALFLLALVAKLMSDTKTVLSKRFVGALITHGLVAILALAPFLLPMVTDHLRGIHGRPDYSAVILHNTPDLLSFLVPDNVVRSYMLRKTEALGFDLPARVVRDVYSTFAGGTHRSIFLGYTVIAVSSLAIFVGFKKKKDIRTWAGFALVFFLLALGPRLHILGQELISLPYALVHQLPFLSLNRAPARWSVMLVLCLAVLVAYGLQWLHTRSKILGLGSLLVALLVLAEFLVAPISTWDAREVPEFYQELAQEDGDFAILQVPVGFAGAREPGGHYMYLQTFHEKRILGGYVSRTPDSAFDLIRSNDLVYALCDRDYPRAGRGRPSITPQMVESGSEELQRLRIHYVILHKKYVQPTEQARLREVLVEMLGIPVYEDAEITAFAVTAGTE